MKRNNFAYDHETCDEDDCGYSGTYVGAGVSLNRQASGSVTKQLCGV